jgi:hypothetical protein
VLLKSSAGSECTPNIPLLLFDGFYGGEVDRITQAIAHDRILMVAGGIGITFFLSFLPNLLEALTTRQGDATVEIPPKEVYLHWICRDEGLVEYVWTHYLFPKIRSLHQCSEAVKFKIFIHYTSTNVDVVEEAHSDKITVDNNMSGRMNSWNASSVGQDVAPGVMCPSWKTSRIQNIIPSLLCVTTYCSGVFVIWNQYLLYKNDDRIWVPLTGLLCLLGLGICVSILVLSVLLRFPQGVCSKLVSADMELSRATQTNVCTSHSPPEVICTLLDSSEIVQIGKAWGRPSMEDIFVPELRNVTSIGVFLCGPNSLVKEVKQYCSSLSQGGARRTRYNIYEESFCL